MQGILHGLLSFIIHHNHNKEGIDAVVTLIRARELKAKDHHSLATAATATATNSTGTTPVLSLTRLYHNICHCSRRYYQNQCHEIKHKLLRLGPNARVCQYSPILLPLVIRYYFKAAMFYEFQWIQTKSLKYMVEAYRFDQLYYCYLWQQQQEEVDTAPDDDDDNGNNHDNDNGYRNGKNNNDDEDEISFITTMNISSATQHHDNKGGSSSGGGGEEGVELLTILIRSMR